MYIQGIANFLDDLLGGAGLIALAIMIGSLVWSLAILRITVGAAGVPDPALHACATWLRRGALAVGVIQAVRLAIKALLLTNALGSLPWRAYLATVQVRAGLMRLALAMALVWVARRVIARYRHRTAWMVAVVIAALIAITDAWLVHGVGRLEARALLMTVTAVHQLVAAVWVGGVIQLVLLWQAGQHDPSTRQFFPIAVTRFSEVGMVSVAVLVASGTALALKYVGSINGIFGTAYGSLVAAKIVLLLIALSFAAFNFSAGRGWLRNQLPSRVMTRVPFYVEAEMVVLFAILFAAASVSSQPPAVDIPDRTATTADVLHMFVPSWPSFESSSHEALIAGEPGRLAVVGRVPSPAATQWSDYNHNVAGVFVAGMALMALISYIPKARAARWWPVGFILLAVFMFFRNDAESWPLGPIGFWESTFGNGEVLQHRLATLLALALGLVELRARALPGRGGWSPYLFPALVAVGGILLLTHAHLPFEIRSDYLIQSTHLVLGLLATVMATSRWLELRLSAAGSLAGSRAAGIVSFVAMLLCGYVLLVYREPLY